mmetsp:Transcript_101851/g.233229  ORF Transcript_101851/g.233229 Transcript_101851/m.233229 type:complete len:98 (+) Transcript_101851:151-444(+)
MGVGWPVQDWTAGIGNLLGAVHFHQHVERSVNTIYNHHRCYKVTSRTPFLSTTFTLKAEMFRTIRCDASLTQRLTTARACSSVMSLVQYRSSRPQTK